MNHQTHEPQPLTEKCYDDWVQGVVSWIGGADETKPIDWWEGLEQAEVLTTPIEFLAQAIFHQLGVLHDRESELGRRASAASSVAPWMRRRSSCSRPPEARR